jgi:heptosyltransferase III
MTHEKEARHSIKRALIIFPGALGDLMCLMPAIKAIARRHAGASIELMSRFGLARLAVGRSVVARGHSIDAREVSELFRDQPPDSARQFFSQFNRIYSFFASDDSRFREHLNAATDGEVSFHPFRPNGEGHVSEAYLRAIGEDGSRPYPLLEPTASDLAAAKHALALSGCDHSNLILIFPGSGSPTKNWPAERFAALASMLSKGGILLPQGLQNYKGAERSGNGVSLAIVLGPAEGAIEPVFRHTGVPILKGLDLPTVAAIARIASAFAGNDSGVSHLAAAVGTSGVVIFGPTDPSRWRPLASRPRQQVQILKSEPIESVNPSEVADVLIKICRRAPKIID